MSIIAICRAACAALCIAAAVAGSASPGQAASKITYVSVQGADTIGCGVSTTSPCLTLQFAHTYTAPGGEIVILGSGTFSALIIRKSISIVHDGEGIASINAAASGNAVTIATVNPTDVVHLRGLEINGIGGGANGVVFKGLGGRLDIIRCIVRGFTGTNADGTGVGILVRGAPNNGGLNRVTFSIADTIVSDNAGVGIYAFQSGGNDNVDGSVTRTTATNNNYGFDLNSFDGPFGVFVRITDSLFQNNKSTDLVCYVANGGRGWMEASNIKIMGSDNLGLTATAQCTVVLYKSELHKSSMLCDSSTAFYTDGANRQTLGNHCTVTPNPSSPF